MTHSGLLIQVAVSPPATLLSSLGSHSPKSLKKRPVFLVSHPDHTLVPCSIAISFLSAEIIHLKATKNTVVAHLMGGFSIPALDR